MISFLKNKWKEDRGAALAIVASSLFLLMGIASISADVAWYYLHASRVQRAADAAALAGVVYLPVAPGTANSTALDIANRNGYLDGEVATNTTVSPAAIGENQLQVRISTEVDTFFAKVLGWDTMTIARSAVAEYIPPLKLGSPDNQFGDSCKPTQPGCTSTSNFWANIHGKWTQTSYGDAYASWCDPNNTFTCSLNPSRRSTGYLYGIESGSSFTVQFIDVGFHNNSGVTTGDTVRTGDRGCEDGGWGGGATTSNLCGATMRVNLYAPDPTPLDISNNALLCTADIPPTPQVAEAAPYVWLTPDGQACWTQSGTGIFIVQVVQVDPGNQNQRSGLNRYSVRSTTGNLFGLGDFSLYNNVPGSTSTFYLAEVETFYHGKTFVVEMYDPGEFSGGGTAQLEIWDPPGTGPFDGGECRVYSRNNVTDPWNLTATNAAGTECQELVSSGEYNRRWLKFEIDLPATYSCGADCWWRVNYIYPTGGVQDTTTWRAYMVGNPIHIID